jgi:6-phosphogluconolactonase
MSRRRPYALDADSRQLFGWTIGEDGELGAIGAFPGVPTTVAGLAAS